MLQLYSKMFGPSLTQFTGHSSPSTKTCTVPTDSVTWPSILAQAVLVTAHTIEASCALWQKKKKKILPTIYIIKTKISSFMWTFSWAWFWHEIFHLIITWWNAFQINCIWIYFNKFNNNAGFLILFYFSRAINLMLLIISTNQYKK